MISRKAASMLSLARRAGRLITGEDTVIMSIKAKGCMLVIIAEDASENTKKKITSRCASSGVPYLIKGEREELGRAVGMYNRTVFAVTDSTFAQKIETELLL